VKVGLAPFYRYKEVFHFTEGVTGGSPKKVKGPTFSLNMRLASYVPRDRKDTAAFGIERTSC